MTGFDRCRGNQSIGDLDSLSEGVPFDDRGRHGADGLGKGQDSKFKPAKRLADLARFESGASTLQKFHP